MKSNYKFIFNRNKRLNRDGKAPVVLEIYFPYTRKRKFIPTKIDISPEHWDEKKNYLSKKYPNYENAKHYLNNLVSKIEVYEYDLINKGKQFTPELLSAFLETGKSKLSFIDFYQNEYERNSSLKRGTWKEHLYTLNILKEFRSQVKPNLSFENINLDTIQDFDNFMRETKKLQQNTIHKHHEHFKRFLKLSVQKGIFEAKNNPYQYFKSKRIPGDRVNLTGTEVAKLEGLNIPDWLPELTMARDLFLFSCFAGLRFSDIQELKPANVLHNSDGLVLSFRMVKVNRPIIIPLNLLFEGKPQEIIKKYLSPGQNFVFPRISNQHMNRLLKVLSQMAEINSRLSFHISRHTFGTLLAELTQNPYLIMDLMGHTDIKTSMIYIHRSQERINKQLINVSWKY
jgi:integrase